MKPATSESMAELIPRLQRIVHARMVELEPQIGEAKWLQEQLEILDYAIEQRDKLLAKIEKLKRPAATRDNVDKWAKALAPDEIVKAADLSEHFGKYPTWGRNHLNRLVNEGIMEKWGRGAWRPKPVRTGAATLHLLTKGA